jgi:hypothetical protein
MQFRSIQLWLEGSVQAAEEKLAVSLSQKLGSVLSARDFIVEVAVRRWDWFLNDLHVPVVE